MLISSRSSSSSSFFTKRPFTRMRESAKFFRTSYFTFFVQTRFFLFSRNRWIRFRRASGEYTPMYCDRSATISCTPAPGA
jgi:hypothetical protein